MDPIEPPVPPQILFDNYSWTQQFTRNYEAYLLLAKRSLEEKLRICEMLTGVRPKSMLDVGCGNGLYLHAGTILGLSVTGTEVDASSAAVARQHGLNVEIGKLEDLDIAGPFDFIHIRMVLHMCPRPIALMRSAVEKLAHNGVVYLDATNQDGLFSRFRRAFQKDPLKYGQLGMSLRCVAYTPRAFGMLLARSCLSPRRRFTYSALDPIYYPLLSHSVKDRAARFIRAGVDYAGMGAFLAAYCLPIRQNP